MAVMVTESDAFFSLTIAEYAAQALTTDQRSDHGSLTFPLLGLFGEIGSLLSEVKKKQRDRTSYLGYAGAVVEELGDYFGILLLSQRVAASAWRRSWLPPLTAAPVDVRGGSP
jgi:hypothetical protein